MEPLFSAERVSLIPSNFSLKSQGIFDDIESIDYVKVIRWDASPGGSWGSTENTFEVDMMKASEEQDSFSNLILWFSLAFFLLSGAIAIWIAVHQFQTGDIFFGVTAFLVGFLVLATGWSIGKTVLSKEGGRLLESDRGYEVRDLSFAPNRARPAGSKRTDG